MSRYDDRTALSLAGLVRPSTVSPASALQVVGGRDNAGHDVESRVSPKLKPVPPDRIFLRRCATRSAAGLTEGVSGVRTGSGWPGRLAMTGCTGRRVRGLALLLLLLPLTAPMAARAADLKIAT